MNEHPSADKYQRTGATGYVGGDALHVIAKAYPNLEITAIVRNSDSGAKVAAKFPKIRLVYGDLDNTDLLTKESAAADIVLHLANSDHLSAAQAIVSGLAKNEKETYLIHISGSAVISYAEFEDDKYGIAREKVFDDWNGIDEVTSAPENALHRNVDKAVLAANKSSGGKVHTAIVCPPTIFGPTRGSGNTRSIQVPMLTKAILERHKGFVVNEGANIWNAVHVQDLSEVFLALVTAALSPDGGKATWDEKGYYFAENEEFTWGDVGKKITKIAFEKKLINSPEVDHLSKEETDKIMGFGSFLWGSNSRASAIRAKKLLGWTPKQKKLADYLGEIVEAEARSLGMKKGHAAQAAGETNPYIPAQNE